jgi:hypothetical protein
MGFHIAESGVTEEMGSNVIQSKQAFQRSDASYDFLYFAPAAVCVFLAENNGSHMSTTS